MTTTLIVLAHPDQRSFTAAWAKASADAADRLGDEVLWSDLYALGFHPAESADRYENWGEAPFDPLKAQERAAADSTLPRDVATEVAKIRAADRIVFHFPLWWFAPPAILKGWCDRALVHGELHTVEERFDEGQCRGKQALFCVSAGASAAECAHNGKEGDVRMLLWPLAYTLRYLGFTVLEPIVVHGVHGYFEGAEREALEARLRATLDAQGDLLAKFDTLPRIQFNADTDFDEAGRLRPNRPSYSPFIRHDP